MSKIAGTFIAGAFMAGRVAVLQLAKEPLMGRGFNQLARFFSVGCYLVCHVKCFDDEEK
jgi:hypothetical protein